MTDEYRWASESGAQGMATVDELEWLGYVKLREHPLYPGTWYMKRETA